ncbi:MAG: molybdopterin-dependent oxidoreductase [Promethearchaeota archaeon]
MKKKVNPDKKLRLPPGQHITKRFPVLQKGRIVHIERKNCNLEINGEIEQSLVLTLEELKKLQDIKIVEDIHCVTSWCKSSLKIILGMIFLST